jgi:hypothetical protein
MLKLAVSGRDRLCGLVVCGLVSEFLTTGPEVPGSIPGATRFAEK